MILSLLRIVSWVYYLQPGFLRPYWGRILGAVLRFFALRARVVEQNLVFAYPSSFPSFAKKRTEVYRKAYEHLGHLVFEILMLLGPMRNFATRFVELRGVKHWEEAKKLGKGVIFLSSHVGNWEVMAAAGALQHGIDIMLVTKRLKPEWLHQEIERDRKRCGVRATYEPKTLKDVLGHLKKNGTVGFVLDQYAGPPVGVRVPFFGVPVSTTTAVATLAKRTEASVLPVVNYRDKAGRFIVEIRPAAAWIKEHEIAANTAFYAKLLEKDVYNHPDQWLWIHRRFKGDLSPLREGEWEQGRART